MTKIKNDPDKYSVIKERISQWGSQGKNTEVVSHSLLQGTTFCQTSPPWPVCLGWPQTAWLSFSELDRAVVHVIRLASCLWLWIQCVCPLMPSLSAYLLTRVSFTLDVGVSLHGCSSKAQPLRLTLNVGSLDGRLLLAAPVPSQPLLHSPRARHPGMWSQVTLRKNHYEQS